MQYKNSFMEEEDYSDKTYNKVRMMSKGSQRLTEEERKAIKKARKGIRKNTATSTY